MITANEFDGLFDSFRSTVYRLEALPAYDVGGDEGERLEAFRRGLPRPERSVRTSPWLARIAVSTIVAGKRWSRTRVVDDPVTDYQRFELTATYPESQAAGDEMWVARRADVGEAGEDFWLFDSGLDGAFAVTMRYDDAGHWLGAERVDDPAALAELEARRRQIAGVAVGLNVFLAELANV